MIGFSERKADIKMTYMNSRLLNLTEMTGSSCVKPLSLKSLQRKQHIQITAHARVFEIADDDDDDDFISRG